jgi:hypothetical protein
VNKLCVTSVSLSDSAWETPSILGPLEALEIGCQPSRRWEQPSAAADDPLLGKHVRDRFGLRVREEGARRGSGERTDLLLVPGRTWTSTTPQAGSSASRRCCPSRGTRGSRSSTASRRPLDARCGKGSQMSTTPPWTTPSCSSCHRLGSQRTVRFRSWSRRVTQGVDAWRQRRQLRGDRMPATLSGPTDVTTVGPNVQRLESSQ